MSFFICHRRVLSFAILHALVRTTGLEPARAYAQQPLKLSCLPISPRPHINIRLFISIHLLLLLHLYPYRSSLCIFNTNPILTVQLINRLALGFVAPYIRYPETMTMSLTLPLQTHYDSSFNMYRWVITDSNRSFFI